MLGSNVSFLKPVALVCAATMAGCCCPLGAFQNRGSSSSSSPTPITPTPPGTPSIPGVPGAPTPGLAPNPDQQLLAKLDEYIQHCLNRFSDQMSRSRERYLSWVPANGPTGSERYISWGVFQIHAEPTVCTQAVARAATMPPSMPDVEQAAQAYAGALTSGVPVINNAHQYYSRGNYRDDAAAQGRLLHPQLMAAYTQFRDANQTLRARLEPVQDQVDAREVARLLREEGRSARYLTKALMVTAKQVVRNGDKMPEQINLAVFTPLVGTLEQQVDELDRFIATNPGEAGNLSSFQSAVREYLVAAKELMRRARDRIPFGRFDRQRIGTMTGWTIEGSPDRVVHEFNDLVRSYNFLRWTRR